MGLFADYEAFSAIDVQISYRNIAIAIRWLDKLWSAYSVFHTAEAEPQSDSPTTVAFFSSLHCLKTPTLIADDNCTTGDLS